MRLKLGTYLRSFYRNQLGGILVISALMLPVLVGAIGLGTDVGVWFFTHQKMQGAADSAAVSAAIANDPTTEAKAVAASYGFLADSRGVAITVNVPPKSGNYTTTSGATEVVISQPQTPSFTAIFLKSPVIITARAVAKATGEGCVLALNRTASAAISAQGSTSVNLVNCSLYDNSSDSAALTVGGSAQISALSVSVVGGETGSSSITTTQGNYTGRSPAADPYAGTNFDGFSGCDQKKYTAKNDTTINPGVYCNGIKLNAGVTVKMNPGVYYIDRGTLDVQGNATLIGDGVTIVFTSSTGSNYATATINSNSTVNLTAPTTGPTAGIVFFQDRNAPAGAAFTLNGGATQNFGGALYLSKAAVTFTGGSSTTGTGCTQLITDTIKFSGNSDFSVNCDGLGVKPLGSAATLIE